MTAAAKARGATRPRAEKNKASDSIPSDRGTARWRIHPPPAGRAATHAMTAPPERPPREPPDHRLDGGAVAGLAPGRLPDAVALLAQDVIHLHGFDHRERLARLDLLALADRDRDHQTGHGAAHGLAGVRGLLRRHQPRRRRLALGVDVGARLDPAVGEIEAVEHRPHLHRDRPIIDGARPYRIARLPGRCQHVRRSARLAGTFETHHERLAFTHDVERDLAFAEPHGSPLFSRHRGSRPLTGNAALSLAEHMIDGS